MPPTQVPVHPAVVGRVRNILSACQYAETAGDYARALVAALSAEMGAECAIWLDGSPAGCVVAQTGPCESALLRLDACFDGEPFVSLDLAAAPMLFRDVCAGVLAVANSPAGFSLDDLDVLVETGRAALVTYESMERAEALGMAGTRRSLADFAHELRQPLGILEICAFYLDRILPRDDARSREQLERIATQLDCANRIVDERTRRYARRDAGETESSRVLTNSAMSMVT